MTIKEIEDRIVGELKGGTVNAVCKTVDAYHGEIDDLVSNIQNLINKLPAVFVLYGGSGFSEPANRSYDEEALFTLIAITKDLRGKEHLKEGMYPLIELIKETLIDNNLQLDIEPLKPSKIEALLITTNMSMYAFDIKTSFSL